MSIFFVIFKRLDFIYEDMQSSHITKSLSFFPSGFHGNTEILIGVLFSLFSSPHLFLNGNLSGERCRFLDRQMPLEKAAGLNERKLICSEGP